MKSGDQPLRVQTRTSVLRGPAVACNPLPGAVIDGVFGGVPFAAGAMLILTGRVVMKNAPSSPAG